MDETLNVNYMVYAKEGTWQEAVGVRDYSIIAMGNITLVPSVKTAVTDGDTTTSSSVTAAGYTKHRLPLQTKIRFNGNATRYAIYIGLSERVMLFQHTPSSLLLQEKEEDGDTTTTKSYPYIEGMDYIPLITTQDFTLYYGSAVMIYPLSKANHPVYYRKPRGFVGRIWYDRDACTPSGVSYWSECKGLSSTMSDEERGEEIEYGDVYYGGLLLSSSSVVTGESDGKMNGTTVSPAPSVDGQQVYIVITFGEAPEGRMMNEEAQSTFEEVLMDFYLNQDILAINDVDLYSVKVWLQRYVVPEVEERRLLQQPSPNQRRRTTRRLQTNTIENAMTVLQYQVTTILTITHSALPHLITRDLLVTALRDNASPFFKQLKLTPELTPYLQNTGSIASIQSVDELTAPPTLAPTDSPTIAITEPLVVKEPISPIVIALILIITIYTCSVLFSTCYIKRARNEMEHSRDQERLLKSTTIEPDIKGSKADFEDHNKPMEETKKKSKKGFRRGLFKKGLSNTKLSARNLMARENSKNTVSSSGGKSGENSKRSSSEDDEEDSYDESGSEDSSEEDSYESEEDEESSSEDDSSGRLSIT